MQFYKSSEEKLDLLKKYLVNSTGSGILWWFKLSSFECDSIEVKVANFNENVEELLILLPIKIPPNNQKHIKCLNKVVWTDADVSDILSSAAQLVKQDT